MKIPRFRLWVLWILVLASGIGIWGYTMRRRSAEYRGRAESHGQQEANCRRDAKGLLMTVERARASLGNSKAVRDRVPASKYSTEEKRQLLSNIEEAERHYRKTEDRFSALVAHKLATAEWHVRMEQKYLRAARYPWLPIEPNPPLPAAPPPLE